MKLIFFIMVLILVVDGLYDGGKRLLHAAEKYFCQVDKYMRLSIKVHKSAP